MANLNRNVHKENNENCNSSIYYKSCITKNATYMTAMMNTITAN